MEATRSVFRAFLVCAALLGFPASAFTTEQLGIRPDLMFLSPKKRPTSSSKLWGTSSTWLRQAPQRPTTNLPTFDWNSQVTTTFNNEIQRSGWKRLTTSRRWRCFNVEEVVFRSRRRLSLKWFGALLIGTLVLKSIAAPWSSMWLNWYSHTLEVQPLLTKCVTSGVLGWFGDVLAQYWEHHQHNSYDNNSACALGLTKSSAAALGTPFLYSKRRGASVFFEGLLWSGPCMHCAYHIMETILPAGTSWWTALAHVVADSVVLDVAFLTSQFWMTGFLEGFSRREVAQQFRTDFRPTLFASWKTSLCLLPIETWSFRFLPLQWRVLAVNGLDLIWDAVVSYHTHQSRRDPHPNMLDDPLNNSIEDQDGVLSSVIQA